MLLNEQRILINLSKHFFIYVHRNRISIECIVRNLNLHFNTESFRTFGTFICKLFYE